MIAAYFSGRVLVLVGVVMAVFGAGPAVLVIAIGVALIGVDVFLVNAYCGAPGGSDEAPVSEESGSEDAGQHSMFR